MEAPLPKWAGGFGHYLRIPYLDKGRDPSVGLDCWGLCRFFYERELGIALPAHETLSSAGDLDELQQFVRAELQHWTQERWPLFGDLMLIRLLGRPVHVGIYLGTLDGEAKFLHSREGCGVALSRIADPRWSDRIEGYYRHG